MRECLLREVLSASGIRALIPPSPLSELGNVIHHLLEAAGRGSLGNEAEKMAITWNDLISQAEQKISESSMQRHQIPLRRNIPDFEVRKLRAFHRARAIADEVFLCRGDSSKKSLASAGFERWVESPDGLVGGYIDHVKMTKTGAVLTDYKSGAILDFTAGEGSGELKLAYQDQMMLYAALYHGKFGVWPVRLEVVPLQGLPSEIAFDPQESESLLEEATNFLQASMKRIEEVANGKTDIEGLASAETGHCKYCLFRPACQTYWMARQLDPQSKWPSDVRGILEEKTQLRNGKICMRLLETDLSSTHCLTIRNITNTTDRHPLINQLQVGDKVEFYGLRFQYHSQDYSETQNTVIYRKNEDNETGYKTESSI